jgi:molybdopterin converting factor subunit 1
MEPNIWVQVMLFASHREIFGEPRIKLSVPEGASVEAVYDELALRQPRMLELRPFTTFAVNREVVDSSTVVHDGDEVALLQPVSGGSCD